MGLEHAIFALGERGAAQHGGQQARVGPPRLAVLAGAGEGDAGNVEGRRIAVHPLHPFAVGAIHVGVFTE